MDPTEILTLVILVLTFIMLIVVAYQAWLTRKSLDAANTSIMDSRITRQIALLGKHYWVIEVEVALERWQNDLQQTSDNILKAVKTGDEDALRTIASHSLHNPSQLSLNKYSYDHMPAWLREIWLSGAQYYYDAIVCKRLVWNKEAGTDYSFSYAKQLAEGRFLESLNAISILLRYIVNMVPQVILNTPASISDEKFLTKQ